MLMTAGGSSGTATRIAFGVAASNNVELTLHTAIASRARTSPRCSSRTRTTSLSA
jgi:hypothetical protein